DQRIRDRLHAYQRKYTVYDSIALLAPDGRLEMFAGRLYLIATRQATGYQGYPGPRGWRGQVMMPLDTAFSFFHQLPDAGSSRRLHQAEQMCPPLQDIMTAAETIRRVVCNGQV